jgi:hypothetical protein
MWVFITLKTILCFSKDTQWYRTLRLVYIPYLILMSKVSVRIFVYQGWWWHSIGILTQCVKLSRFMNICFETIPSKSWIIPDGRSMRWCWIDSVKYPLFGIDEFFEIFSLAWWVPAVCTRDGSYLQVCGELVQLCDTVHFQNHTDFINGCERSWIVFL